MYGNGRPVGNRMRVRLLVAVVLLAWATQTLLHQWGYGAEVRPGVETFVPGTARFAAGATLEMRGEATLRGSEVKLKQVCRWSDADAGVFAPVADLTIARLSGRSAFRALTLDEIRTTLRDAGVNLAVVKFAGPVSCTITRSDGEYDPDEALRQWANAADAAQDAVKTDPAPTTRPAAVVSAQSPAPSPVEPKDPAGTASSQVTLRSLLAADLSSRIGVAPELLQLTFNPKDEKVLALAEPLFKFNLEPRRVRNLGAVEWLVTIVTPSGTQKVSIAARAQAWQKQVTVVQPLAYHQVIRASDVTERRVLADQLPDEPLLTSEQVIGQEAARDLKDGAVLTARMVDPVPLVKPGQLVTITLQVGAVSVKSVGRALEAGSYGQAVKVRNDATRDTFEVIMTGPQEGAMGPLAPAGK